MRPARIIVAVTLAAAAVVSGSYLAVSTTHPSAAALTAPVTAPPLQPTPPVDLPQPPSPTPRVPRVPAPRPVLADGRYDSYIRRVETPYEGGTSRLVVDLVQVFQGQDAVKAAIADGMPRDQAQVLYVWVRNQNPRLRTLPMASDLRLDLLPGDCIESRNHQFAKLIKDSRAISNSRPAYYFTLTVAGGVVHRIQEDKTFNAC
jgi:hypothetical protein